MPLLVAPAGAGGEDQCRGELLEEGSLYHAGPRRSTEKRNKVPS